jgi:hypothetical protein
MRSLLAILVCIACVVAQAQTVVVRGPAIVTAQDHAVVIARRGALVHSGCNQYEGIGCGPTPEAARRACCFFGQRPIVEEGVAYSPVRRQWFAVIRYR